MNLTISIDTRIGDIKQAFNAMYPYLRIEVVDHSKTNCKQSVLLPWLNNDVETGSLLKNKAPTCISMDGKMTVAELQKEFHEVLGVQLQLFRKLGNYLIEASLTSNWTLDKQNSEAAAFNQLVKKSPNDQLEDEPETRD